jgi:polyhydroxybutyrate depolymerase
VILLHGFGVTGALQERYLRLTDATDAHDMLFTALDGTKSPLGPQFWNATDACCDAGAGVDDVAYLAAVIADIKARYAVDPRRVFLVGHSNGGFMSYRMACDHAEEIAAIVSIAGATFADPGRCSPTEPVATLEVHGTADHTIAYRGGRINGRGAPYPGALRTVRAWAKYDGCRLDDPHRTRATRRIVDGLPRPSVLAYSDCRGNGHAELWTQPRGSHIPAFTAAFREQVVDFLLAHPKP